MFKILAISLSTLIFVSCSVKGAESSLEKSSYSIRKFKDENFYLLLALDQELSGDLNSSNNTFYKLYSNTQNIEYLREHLSLLNLQGEQSQVIEFVTSSEEEQIRKDIGILRTLTNSYIKNGDVRKAIETLLKVIKREPRESDHQLLSELYFANKDYENSLKSMRDAYYISSKTEYMEAISKLLYLYLGRKKEAIRNLETHKRLYGCNKYLCIYLINFYGDMDNIPMVIQTYQELYKSSREERFALQLINIYKQQGDYGGLIGFLKSSGFDNSMLLKIYMSQKLFSEGLKLSQKLYRKEGKPEHLAQSAIFEYEANRIDISRNTLLSIVVKLETAVKELEDPLYLNFLGYLMIDNSIRVADGVEYVKRALKKEPESIFFLDSLAWGYYKLGRCKDAEREIRKLIDSGIRDKEILSHWETIKGCIK